MTLTSTKQHKKQGIGEKTNQYAIHAGFICFAQVVNQSSTDVFPTATTKTESILENSVAVSFFTVQILGGIKSSSITSTNSNATSGVLWIPVRQVSL